MRGAAIAIALVLALAGAARAEPAWRATRGTLELGRAEGAYILTTDAAPGRYSEATMIAVAPVALPYQLSATIRRLGPEGGRSIHLLVAGGIVLIKSGAIAFYPYDDNSFASTGWTPIAGYVAHDEHVLAVAQDRHAIEVSIDGRKVATFAIAVERVDAIGFGVKGAPSMRSALYLRDLHRSQ